MNPPHLTYNQALYTKPSLKEKISFCCVRNPFDRFVSFYRFVNRDYRLKLLFGKNYKIIKEKIKDLDRFIKSQNLFPKDVFGSNFITNQIEFSENINHTFKYENLEELEKFLYKFNVSGRLPRLNVHPNSLSKNKAYRNLYNLESYEFVNKQFKRDLEEYGYKF